MRSASIQEKPAGSLDKNAYMICSKPRIYWVIPRTVRSISMRSKLAGLGFQNGSRSAPQLMSRVCQRFPSISNEVLSGRRSWGGQAIGERTALGGIWIYQLFRWLIGRLSQGFAKVPEHFATHPPGPQRKNGLPLGALGSYILLETPEP